MNSQRQLRNLLKNSLSLQPRETLLVAAEESAQEVGDALWHTSRKCVSESVLVKFSWRNGSRHGLPAAVFQGLQQVDAAVILTPHLLLPASFEPVLAKRTRVLVVYNTTPGQLERSLQTAYGKISYRSRRLADIFSIGKKLRVTAPNGTDVTFDIARIKGKAETGLSQQAGELAYLPAGEACVLFNKSNAEGAIVLDRLAGRKKRLAHHITLRIKNGHITQIKGAAEADHLRKELRKIGTTGRGIFELGVGTNDRVEIGRSPQEDEKALGTVHVSIGKDFVTKSQGKLIQSVRGLVLSPTLTIDGRTIVEDGKILV